MLILITFLGKYIKNCVGSPPPDTFDKKFLANGGLNLVVDDLRVKVNEDSEQGINNEDILTSGFVLILLL